MLAYLDRAPPELAPAARLALTAIRVWAAHVRRGSCPVGLLRELFVHWSAPGSLWPAHNLFYWTATHAARPLHLGCPCCGRVSDDEAALLTGLFAQNPKHAKAALADLVTPMALMGALRLARSLGAELSAAKLRPSRPG